MAETPSLDWLTPAYLRDVLRKGLKKNNLEVLQVQVEPATKAGDNYGSQMLRMNIVIKRDSNQDPEKLSVVSKMLPASPFSAELTNASIFQKEARMFLDVLPSMHALLKKAFPDHEMIHAACYGYDSANRDAIFLEDLRVAGYRLADRFAGGLDEAHTNLAFTALGKYHAAAVVHAADHPELKEQLSDNFWCLKYSHFFRHTFKNATDAYTKMANGWPDGPEKEQTLKKLDWMDKELLMATLNTYDRDDNAFNLLVHGDCWINNMMFKYQGTKPIGFKLCDYQIVGYNSPVLDLIYFIFISLSDDIRFGNRDGVLKIYHDAFAETLKRLEFVLDKPYTFDDLKKDFEKRLLYGFAVVLVLFPITICPPSETVKVDDIFGEYSGSAVSHLYNNPTMDYYLRKCLKYFEKYIPV